MKNYDPNNELLDNLMEFIKRLPQPVVTMIHPIRYRAMMKAASNLKALLAENLEEGEINITIDETFRLGAVSVVLDNFSVSNMPQLQEVLAETDCFEIFPLTNGKVQLDLTFQGVLKTVY